MCHRTIQNSTWAIGNETCDRFIQQKLKVVLTFILQKKNHFGLETTKNGLEMVSRHTMNARV